VVLDVMRQIETHLLQSHYDGFLRKGRIRGRFDRMQSSGGKVASSSTVVLLWIVIAVLTLIGIAAFVLKTKG
jgi:preprotein translocase subunit SecY